MTLALLYLIGITGCLCLMAGASIVSRGPGRRKDDRGRG